MLLKIFKNRTVSSSGTWGTKNENNYEILNFEFPEELEEYNKRIVYYLGNQKVWDAIIDNKAILTNAITTKGSVKAYVWCTKSDEAFETDVDFRTQIFVMNFFENENADGIVPTPEQVDGFNTMLTEMNAKIDEADALEQTIGAAEAQRQENEETRQENESIRQENEQTRQEQEAERERRTDEAIGNIEDKTAEYNANAEAKTTAFNNNATQKTNDFNNNYTQKVNGFNTNATNKTTDFNTNAENKTSAFNTNASDKTSDFNTNAESKTNTFNDNATQKTTDFNNNAQAKIDEYDAHIVDYQAQIDDLQNEVEELSENMPWNTTEQATEISVDDAAKYSKNKLELFGNTEQAQYTGKNLLPYPYTESSKTAKGITFTDNGDGSLTINGTAQGNSSFTLFGSAYPDMQENFPGNYISGKNCSNSILCRAMYADKQESGAVFYRTAGQSTGTSVQINTTQYPKGYAEITVLNGTTVDNVTIYPMITDTQDNDYEPYTGGQPSPSPDYPQPIHVVTGNNTISIQGKNLIDYSALNKYNRDLSGAPSVGSPLRYYNNSKALQFNVSVSNFVGKNIFFSFDFSHTNFRRFALDTNGNYIETFSNGGLIKENYSYITILINSNVDIPTSTDIKFMAVQGSTATSYVPYYHADYPINLGSLELCKIGDYQDYLYKEKENENWYKYEAIRHNVITGASSEEWNWIVKNENKIMIQSTKVGQCIDGRNFVAIFSNNFKGANGEDVYSVYNNHTNIIGCAESNRIRIAVSPNDFANIDEFKNFLQENNLDYYFVLATPIVTQITDTTLITQLNEIYEHLQLIKGTNNITVTASDLAPYMELSYMQDLPSKLDNLDSRLALLE